MKKKYQISVFLMVATLLLVGCSSEVPESNQSEKIDSTELKESIEQKSIQSEESESTLLEESEESEIEEVGKIEEEGYSKVLNDIKDMNRYTTKMKSISNVTGYEVESLITNVVADDQTYSLIETENGILEHIEKDDKSYLIMHDSKTIIKSDRYEEEEDNLVSTDPTIVYDDLEYISKGQDTFLGNKRAYEEYKMELGTVKYYFDGEELDGMEITMDMSSLIEDDEDFEENEELFGTDEVIMILDLLSFEKEVDMTVFDLPEDYQIIGE
ncbi:hypothetical protein LZ578_05010 [Jeotgalibaca sp. MA1X17-3]|uniref:hypothetical protein n=1 Tax=Jeotgalibaca sp. MA1X17-3 TaxID=2908211 RepID=UPI001F35A3B1|nr:hypothetical protein [Jeotgalibaca sp. MA1X17-3]UJF16467.1 hypothetical protein LZ578_05010 [Jeotgalibaca sp. MA1X17-3]